MLKTKSAISIDLLNKNSLESLEVIELTENLKLRVEKYYQHLLKSYYPFDALCWALAELALIFEKGSKKYSENDVIKRAEKIIDSDIDYDTLCLLISCFKVYIEENKLYP